MNRTSQILTAFMTGCITGAALGLLYAPDKGAVTRDRLTYRLSKYREQLRSLLDDILKTDQLPASVAKTEGQRVVNDAREKAEKLLEDVDRLMAQIKQQGS
ncbi:YtxH domain-containing protein [Larkinella rosea]|jgi:gas vesicle protein|uniref:YtxH domain-containing protein n=1 Tax=Larkinella rosea TaxID=2025312 RepID=A0A3P1BMH5_9BACT|nr:YtxH domain-containing protein [Larkinella rosea]RRB02252.1 YtxH domain-containing protein [Larkinella rosea]